MFDDLDVFDIDLIYDAVKSKHEQQMHHECSLENPCLLLKLVQRIKREYDNLYV
jgi:hypothetical protein